VTTNVFKSETGINKWSSQIIGWDEKSLASKWVMMGTIKAKLCKQIAEETYMGQLEWARSQTTKITQIRDIKSSSIKQTRRLRRNGGLYFKSGKNTCISFKLWDIGQRVLQTPQETSLMRSIKWKATLKWPSLKSLLEIFHLWEILNRGGRPRELGRNKKNKKKSVYFSIAFLDHPR
jgi:hypothetical protein